MSDIALTIICTWRISVMVTMNTRLFKLFHGQVLLILFYIRLPSNVTVFSDICLNQAHVLKAQNKCSLSSLLTQNQQIFHSIIISCWPISSDHVGIKIIDYFQSTTTFRVMLGKDDFSLWWHNIWFSYFFKTREGYMPTITESRFDHWRDNLYQASLSEIATDRDWTRSCYNLTWPI